jgi:hypothetical protein
MAEKPTSRTEATKPKETEHLDEAQKQALDDQSLVEHSDGPLKEKLAQDAQKKAGRPD